MTIKQINKNIITVNWNYLSSFIGHEMFKGMKKSMQSILNEHNINNNDVRPETINLMLKCLEKKRNIDKEQREYIKRLINISSLYCMCILSVCHKFDVDYMHIFVKLI